MYPSIALSPGEEQRYLQDVAKRLRSERVRQARHQATKLSQASCRKVHEIREQSLRQQEALEVQHAVLSKTVEIEELLEECAACQEVEGLALRAASAHAHVIAAADARQEQLATLRWKLEQLRAAESLHLNRHEILQHLSSIAAKLEKQKQVRNVERQRAQIRAKQGQAAAAAVAVAKAADEEAVARAKAERRRVLSDHRYGAVDYSRTYYHVQRFAPHTDAPEVQLAEFDRSPSPPPQLTTKQRSQQRARSNSAVMSAKAEQTVRAMKESLDFQARSAAKAATVEAQIRARRASSARARKAAAPDIDSERRSQDTADAQPARRRVSSKGTQACSKGVSKGPLRPAAGPRGVRAKPSADHVVRRLNEAISSATPADADEQMDARSEPQQLTEELPHAEGEHTSRADSDHVVGLLNEALLSSATEQLGAQQDVRLECQHGRKPASSSTRGRSPPSSAVQVVGLLSKALLLSEPANLEEEGDDSEERSDTGLDANIHISVARTPDGSSPMPKATHLDGLLSEAEALLSGIVAPFDSILTPPNGTWLPALERLPKGLGTQDSPAVGTATVAVAEASDNSTKKLSFEQSRRPSSSNWRRHVRAHGEDLGLELEQICRDLHSVECSDT
mmetsp:Transcript_25447/g.58631  ORF Transcript_25447/g.58631 Transcript_25447/m.58631 type:complete len:623 (-) Transcript_25447:4-1872(-)